MRSLSSQRRSKRPGFPSIAWILSCVRRYYAKGVLSVGVRKFRLRHSVYRSEAL
jgi:hypothetical protein